MTTLPGLELPEPASDPGQHGMSLAATRAPRRKPNPYLHLDNNTLRGIRAGHCPACREPVLAGVDEDWCAAVVRVDVTPLSAIGEASCVLAGRPTYSLDDTPARLTRRRASRMKMQPAGDPRKRWHKYDVLPLHECGNPVNPEMTIPSMLEYTPPRRIDPDEPAPF